ncbi:MAG: hypothetical protein IJS39_16685 [Synergistaceae bacterium]|nr:hypothetical protein [Synergistaceae bacterium]
MKIAVIRSVFSAMMTMAVSGAVFSELPVKPKRLGVQRGDVIKSVNGIPFTNMGDIANSINSLCAAWSIRRPRT